MRIVLGIEYEGSRGHGWQRQEDSPDTIQQNLEEALTAIAGHRVELHASGRTDRGVHASGQVAHFLTTTERPFDRWITGPNALLPRHIAVRWAQVLDDERFHARHSAIARSYCYLWHNSDTPSPLRQRHCAWLRDPLDADLMHRALQALVGEHDFESFRAAACQARHARRRVTSIEIERSGDLVALSITANAFVHKMVRLIAGTAADIGRGRLAPEAVAEILAQRRRGHADIQAAPARGLHYLGPAYPERYGLPAACALPASLFSRHDDRASPGGTGRHGAGIRTSVGGLLRKTASN